MNFPGKVLAAAGAVSLCAFLFSVGVANAEVGVLNDPPPAPPPAKAVAPSPAKKPAAKRPAARKAATQAGKPLHVESFGDWKVVCPTKDKKSCFARILLVDQEKRQPAISWFVARRNDSKGTMAFLNVPLGVLLSAGVTVEVKDKPRKFPFSRCTPQGCNALFPMDPDFVSQLSAMNTVSVTVVGPNTQALAYTVSLKGFGDAMKRIE